ncbi:hypothetical protein E2C01_040049 [Portunus trituberculatus]|uniref:Uncharacterized protein n=1 Tax=Portunus trituberculatus TaxID=210409 RepID=A0A5B7FIM2_PORTR|nr:hypothetical protein [Portunus trituberculatus]
MLTPSPVPHSRSYLRSLCMFIRQVCPIRPSPASPGLVISVAPRSTCRYGGDLPLMSSGRGRGRGESEGMEREREKDYGTVR